MLYKLNVQAYRKESLIIKRKHEADKRKTTILVWVTNARVDNLSQPAIKLTEKTS